MLDIETKSSFRAHPWISLSIFTLAILFFLFFVRQGSLDQDTATYLLAAKKIASGEIPLPFVSAQGTHGHFNGASVIYGLLLQLQLTSFELGKTFILSGLMATLSVFLIASLMPNFHYKAWVAAFAFTSPSALFQLNLISYGLLFLLLSLVVFLHLRGSPKTTTGFSFYEFTIGLLLGHLTGYHPTVVVIIASIIFMRLMEIDNWNLRFKTGTTHLLGGLTGGSHYLYGVYLNWSQMNITATVSGQEDIWWDIPLSFFKYFGKFHSFYPHSLGQGWINTSPLLNFEIATAYISYFLIIFLFVSAGQWVYNNWKQISKNRIVFFVLLTSVLSSLFGVITNSLHRDYTSWQVWWATPILLVFVVTNCFFKKRNTVLALLLTVNIISCIVSFGPRMVHGTGLAGGLAPSWWMQEKVVDQLCDEIKMAQAEDKVIIEVACKYCDTTLVKLMEIRNPKCFKNAKFFTPRHNPYETAERGSGRVLKVSNSEDDIHIEVNWFTR
ncbi:MAG: hypothetical protein HOM97_14080 [Nitrospina sp.]|jgi:hypothetical protein|nr:hypothetical protein [Nitrospina sp.]